LGKVSVLCFLINSVLLVGVLFISETLLAEKEDANASIEIVPVNDLAEQCLIDPDSCEPHDPIIQVIIISEVAHDEDLDTREEAAHDEDLDTREEAAHDEDLDTREEAAHDEDLDTREEAAQLLKNMGNKIRLG
jgi:hypothetical protein